MIYYRNGLSFAGEYRGKLAVEGSCLIAVVCDWFIIYSQGWDANVFSFLVTVNYNSNSLCRHIQYKSGL